MVDEGCGDAAFFVDPPARRQQQRDHDERNERA